MCQSRIIIILLLLLKIIVLFIIPVAMLFLKRNDRLNQILIKVEIILLLLLISFCFAFKECMVNSSLFHLNMIKYNDIDNLDSVVSTNDVNVVEEIVTNKIYKNINNDSVYYFNNNTMPLSNKKIVCNNKDLYMKNYGNDITSISILLSSLLDKNIDPIQILKYSVENEMFDCETGVSVDGLINMLSVDYGFNRVSIPRENLLSYVGSGGIVLAKVKPSSTSLTCNKSSVVIYNVTKENKFFILSPDDRDYDYICPENTEGYGSVIHANINDKIWSLEEINAASYEYIALERN